LKRRKEVKNEVEGRIKREVGVEGEEVENEGEDEVGMIDR
jgi:hypothetical protein